MAAMMADIKDKIGSKQNIDAVLLVLKRTDYRKTFQEQFAIKTVQRWLANSKSDNIFMILTHCDKEKSSEEFILRKLDSLNSIMKNEADPIKREIKRENVINFDNSIASLRPMISKLQNSDMHFHENMKANEIIEEH